MVRSVMMVNLLYAIKIGESYSAIFFNACINWIFYHRKFPDAWSGSYCRDKFGIDTSGVPKKTDES